MTAIDAGEDGLGDVGVHTINLNIAHTINDKDDEVLKQAIEHLEADLPGDAEIRKIKIDIAKINEKLGIVKDEVIVNGIH